MSTQLEGDTAGRHSFFTTLGTSLRHQLFPEKAALRGDSPSSQSLPSLPRGLRFSYQEHHGEESDA